MVDLLVRPDDADCKHRAPVICPIESAREDRVRNYPGHLASNADFVDEALASMFGVHHDTVKAVVDPPPERDLLASTSREDVVRRDDRGTACRQRSSIELGEWSPLNVENVPLPPTQSGESDRVLSGSDRQAKDRSTKKPRAERIEQLGSFVSVRFVAFAKSESRRHELNISTSRRECAREVVVVWRRKGRRIENRDAQTSRLLSLLALACSHLEPCAWAHAARDG